TTHAAAAVRLPDPRGAAALRPAPLGVVSPVPGRLPLVLPGGGGGAVCARRHVPAVGLRRVVAVVADPVCPGTPLPGDGGRVRGAHDARDLPFRRGDAYARLYAGVVSPASSTPSSVARRHGAAAGRARADLRPAAVSPDRP